MSTANRLRAMSAIQDADAAALGMTAANYYSRSSRILQLHRLAILELKQDLDEEGIRPSEEVNRG